MVVGASGIKYAATAWSSSLGRLSKSDKGWDRWLMTVLLFCSGDSGLLLLLPLLPINPTLGYACSAAMEIANQARRRKSRCQLTNSETSISGFLSLPLSSLRVRGEDIPLASASGNDMYDDTPLHQYDKARNQRPPCRKGPKKKRCVATWATSVLGGEMRIGGPRSHGMT